MGVNLKSRAGIQSFASDNADSRMTDAGEIMAHKICQGATWLRMRVEAPGKNLRGAGGRPGKP